MPNPRQYNASSYSIRGGGGGGLIFSLPRQVLKSLIAFIALLFEPFLRIFADHTDSLITALEREVLFAY